MDDKYAIRKPRMVPLSPFMGVTVLNPSALSAVGTVADYPDHSIGYRSKDDKACEWFRQMLQRFTYKPGYVFELYGGDRGSKYDDGLAPALIIRYTAIDATDPAHKAEIMLRVQHPVIPASVYPDERQFMSLMRSVCSSVERHETDEWLKLDGNAPFYPHLPPRT